MKLAPFLLVAVSAWRWPWQPATTATTTTATTTSTTAPTTTRTTTIPTTTMTTTASTTTRTTTIPTTTMATTASTTTRTTTVATTKMTTGSTTTSSARETTTTLRTTRFTTHDPVQSSTFNFTTIPEYTTDFTPQNENTTESEFTSSYTTDFTTDSEEFTTSYTTDYTTDTQTFTSVTEGPSRCEELRKEILNSNSFDTHWIPECDEFGNFESVQCNYQENSCWCVEADGEIIPEVVPWNMKFDVRPSKKHCVLMTKCERLQEKLINSGLMDAWIPECNKNGMFKKLQCNYFSGTCWCMTPNGETIEDSYEHFPNYLPLDLDTTKCEDVTKCEKMRKEAQDSMMESWIPECDEDGNFQSIQCKYQVNSCWCVEANGEIIPEAVPWKAQFDTRPSKKHCVLMTKCERLQEKLIHSGVMDAWIPACDKNGMFEKLQCDYFSRTCWCLTSGGEDIEGSDEHFPNGLPTDLHEKKCNDLTKCEHMRQVALDSMMMGAWIPECDEDGEFNSKQCNYSARTCWCVDSDGEGIEGSYDFFEDPSLLDGKECGIPDGPCTRLQHHFDENNHIHSDYYPQCDEDGNFSPKQCAFEVKSCWCVLQNGDLVPHSTEFFDSVDEIENKDCKNEHQYGHAADFMHLLSHLFSGYFQGGRPGGDIISNVNYAPMNTNQANHININNEFDTEININFDGEKYGLESMIKMFAHKFKNGHDMEYIKTKIADIIKHFGLQSHIDEYQPIIESVAEKHGIKKDDFSQLCDEIKSNI